MKAFRGGEPVSTRLHTPSSRRPQVQAQSTLASPRLRGMVFASPSVTGSATPAAASTAIPINDDAAERRRRRLETRTHAAASPGCHTPSTLAATHDRFWNISASCIPPLHQPALNTILSLSWVNSILKLYCFCLLAGWGPLTQERQLSVMPKYLITMLCVWSCQRKMWVDVLCET